MPGTKEGAAKARKARRKKRLKRVRESGAIEDARKELWRAILYCKDVLRDAETPELKLKSVHAMQQATSSYVRLVESSELEERLTALEEAEQARGKQMRKVV